MSNQYHQSDRFSDHRGIVMVINSGPKIKVIPTRITWNLDEKKVQKFIKALEPKMIEWEHTYNCLYKDKQNVELLVEYFQLIIVETATQIFGFKKYCQDRVNWVDKKVHKILKKRRKSATKYHIWIVSLKRGIIQLQIYQTINAKC